MANKYNPLVKRRLTRDQWQAIRKVWEHDLNRPTLSKAAKIAAKKYNFDAPSTAAVSRRAEQDRLNGYPWDRGGTMKGINKNAQIKADYITSGEDDDAINYQRTGTHPLTGRSLSRAEMEGADVAEDMRAEVIARHRSEWKVSIVLRNEALINRKVDIKKSLELAKLAKMAAEMIYMQQTGERRAWGLEEFNLDMSKLTDEQLQDVINGKLPR